MTTASTLHRLLGQVEARAPRYTSYPTAMQFSTAVGTAQRREWLAALPDAEPVSLYLHIPFCDRLCWYCGCHTTVVRQRAPVAAYVDDLLREIDLVGAAIGRRLAVSSIHFGGGTPNLLQPADLEQILAGIHRRFAPIPNVELAMELDPRVLTRDWIAAAAALGLSRASLGVQDNAPQVQQAVNRVQSWFRTASLIEALREAGVASINLDLIYGLPHQTMSSLLQTVEDVTEVRPERIALFGYAHVPWMKPAQQQIPETALPDAEERFRQQQVAAWRLQSAGYRRIGLDHFATPEDGLSQAHDQGRLHRNFQGYTTDSARTLLGFGASSISRFDAGFVQNEPRVPLWRESLAEGRLPCARGIVLDADDAMRAAIIERLMCDLAVDLSPYGGRAAFAGEEQALAAFTDHKLVSWNGDTLHADEAARPFLRSICSAFDRHFRAAEQRHSLAV